MKKLHPKSTIDELCYPYIYEDSLLCDYEILTDDLTRSVGWAIAELTNLQLSYPNNKDLIALKDELNWLLPLCYHLNGSIRGKLAITEEDHQQLLKFYRQTADKTKTSISGFVLPGGVSPVGILNKCSSTSKQAIRLMVKIHNNEQINVPEILPKFTNVLCNYFFTATILINQVTGFKETPFISKSYK
jgi:cob(I)alamin adenosyltransferase